MFHTKRADHLFYQNQVAMIHEDVILLIRIIICEYLRINNKITSNRVSKIYRQNITIRFSNTTIRYRRRKKSSNSGTCAAGRITVHIIS